MDMDYKLFLIPIIILVLNQIVKLVIEWIKGDLGWSRLFGYGGMPSTHGAVVTSLCYTIGYYQGLKSPTFAIVLVMSLLILRDAWGIRWQLGYHGQVLNRLIKELPDQKEYAFPILKEKFGHTKLEVLVGIIFGFLSTVLLVYILN